MTQEKKYVGRRLGFPGILTQRGPNGGVLGKSPRRSPVESEGVVSGDAGRREEDGPRLDTEWQLSHIYQTQEEIRMKIETERLVLRELTMNDLDDLHAIFSDHESMRHYPGPFSLEKTKKWIEWNIKSYVTSGFGLWGVILKEENRLIGDCGITMQGINGKMVPEIGYHINKNYTNRGYATEAAIACRDYAFIVLNFNRLYSYMKYTNAPSMRVAEKNGMKFVAEIEDQKNIKTRIYSISRDEIS